MPILEDLQRQGCIVRIDEDPKLNVTLKLQMNDRIETAVIQYYKLIGLTERERNAVIQSALEVLAERMFEPWWRNI